MSAKKKAKHSFNTDAISDETKKASPKTVLWYFAIITCFIFHGAFFAGELLVLTFITLTCLLSFSRKINIDLNFIFLGCILLFATISFSLLSIDKYESFVELQKYVIIFLSYFILINIKNINVVEKAYYCGIVLLMICGILGIIGVEIFSPLVTEKGQRLQSFLQYANTTALFMGIGILLSVDRYIKLKKIRYVVFSVLFATALYFTQSRITFVIFIFIFATYIFISLKGKVKIIFGGLLISFLIIVLCVGGRIIRISFLEPTLIERLITYSDATKELISKPVLGIGLGNWQYLSFSFQTAPYQVRYIHNMYLQIAMDSGLFATAIFFILILYNIIKKRNFTNIYYYIFIFIILHSALEVNFNYGIFNMFFAFTMALITKQSNKSHIGFSLNISKITAVIKNTAIIIFSIIIIIPAFSEAFITFGDFSLKKGNSYIADSYYKKAHSLNQSNNTLSFKLAQTEKNADVAISLLEKTLLKNPYQFSAKYSLIEGYLYRGNYAKAIEEADCLLKSFPYNRSFQDLNRNAITKAYENGLLNNNQYQQKIKELEAFIYKKNSNINPLYKYIDNNMNY